MSMNYPYFTFSNESVVLMPGTRFTKVELKSRLHQMDVDADDIQDKKALVNLYESTLSNHQNKLKIFNKLRKDTEMHHSRLGISQRQTAPPFTSANMSNNSNNSKSKVLNISNDVRAFNAMDQNRNQNRPFISNNTNIEQNDETVNYGESEQKLRQPNYVHKYNLRSNKQRVSQDQNNNYDYDYNDNNYSNSYYQNNEAINRRNKMGGAPGYAQGYQEEINTDINRNSNQRYIPDNYNYNEKIYTNEPTPNNQTYPEFTRNNYNNRIEQGQNENEKMNVDPHPVQNLEEEDYSRRYQPEPDEESTFSIFSTFKDFKNTSIYKNRKQICINTLLSILVIGLALGTVHLAKYFWNSISDFFVVIFNLLCDPKRIFVDGVWGFITSLFFGSISYWYITIPLIIFLVVLCLYLRRYLIKKRCQEIFKKIKEFLNNRENERIFEEEIYKKFVEPLGIGFKEYVKKYLPILRKMRRDEINLKVYSEIINGKNVLYWALGY